MTFIALGWQIGTLTGWGQFGAHFARTASQAGYRVILPPGSLTDLSGVLPMDRPILQALQGPLPDDEDGVLCMAIGNGMEPRPTGLPSSIKVAGIIFCEDTGAIDATVLNAYDLIVAGSRWTERVLKDKGVERVVLAHQGYDSRVFFPAVEANPRRRGPMVFSGGKLEFRKGQDIVVDAFKRFRLTAEGKDAVLVVAWDNPWPKTMDGIWLSGYVKGVPTVKNGRAEIVPWLVANGLPAESVIDCGRLSPPEAAHVMRSCSVGLFPNRAESGTNMVLVEALASGLPCIVGDWTGQADVCATLNSLGGLMAGATSDSIPVPPGCQLYRSTEGWQEQPAGVWASALRDGGIAQAPSRFPDYWSWDVRGPAMAEAVVNREPAPALP